MSVSVDNKIWVVIPSWNHKHGLGTCIDSLIEQSLRAEIVVVENGSTDGSADFLAAHYPAVTVLPQSTNLGFAGGVNVGLCYATERGAEYIALFNNDAIANTDWLLHLVSGLRADAAVGIATSCMMNQQGAVDSTGEFYTAWGLPYPRGRDEPSAAAYKAVTTIFGASGGASLFRASMLAEIGLFDEDFFAYYEDVDLSFRAQLAGWKIIYVPDSIVYHETGATGRQIKGFYAYQTMKNLPLLAIKNVPRKYLWHVMRRLTLARTFFLLRAISRGQGWPAIKGDAMATKLIFKKLKERKHIKAMQTVSDDYIWSIITHDLPPNAAALRKLRTIYWKLTGKTDKK